MQPKKKILIVEDDESLRHLLKDTFERDGSFEIAVAGNGIMALDLVEKFMPDLALVDIGLPGIDGITLVRMMSEKHFTDKTKVFFLTNSSDISKIAVASGMHGVLGYLIKADWDISAIVDQVKSKLQ